jgi:glycosyltransferase involved in cell wall biosynthesis
MEKYGVSGEKIHVIEVGIDSVEPLTPLENNKNWFVVMYSGVLGIGYDFETVLKAAVSVSKYNDIVFLIRGIGELAPRLEQLIGELNLRNVVLDTNLLSKKKLSTLLRSADAFLLPMSSASFVDEGLPAKVFEYQAYGKPILCCSNGQPGKYVSETKSGIVVELGDYKALAKSILYLKRNNAVAKKLGAYGRSHVENNLTIEKIGSRMEKLFQALT